MHSLSFSTAPLQVIHQQAHLPRTSSGFRLILDIVLPLMLLSLSGLQVRTASIVTGLLSIGWRDVSRRRKHSIKLLQPTQSMSAVCLTPSGRPPATPMSPLTTTTSTTPTPRPARPPTTQDQPRSDRLTVECDSLVPAPPSSPSRCHASPSPP